MSEQKHEWTAEVAAEWEAYLEWARQNFPSEGSLILAADARIAELTRERYEARELIRYFQRRVWWCEGHQQYHLDGEDASVLVSQVDALVAAWDAEKAP